MNFSSEIIISLKKMKNSHPRDSWLSFEPRAHRYRITDTEGKLWADNPDSVSKVAARCFERFNADHAISKIKDKPEYKDLSPQAIKEQWNKKGKDACIKGTRVHLSIENTLALALALPHGMPYGVPDHVVSFPGEYWDSIDELLKAQFFRWWEARKKEGWKPYRLEWCVWNLKPKPIAGTIDAVFETPKGFVIVDWKTCREIKKNGYGGKKAKSPLQEYEDCNFIKYAVQLNLYRYILEHSYGLSIADMQLVNFNEAQLGAKVYRAPRFTAKQITQIINY
jgi:hypothetical protein